MKPTEKAMQSQKNKCGHYAYQPIWKIWDYLPQEIYRPADRDAGKMFFPSILLEAAAHWLVFAYWNTEAIKTKSKLFYGKKQNL